VRSGSESVDEPDDDIDQQIDADDKNGQQKHPGLHHGKILIADRVDSLGRDARPGEHGFRDNGAPQELSELQADDGDHRNADVFKGVFEQHGIFG